MPDLSLEIALQANGYLRIAGIDEAGRGPLAGPVAAAAVILPKNFNCPGLDDSKKISPKLRDRLYERLTNDPEIYWAVATAEREEIDRINILRATHLAMRRAAEALVPIPAYCLIDGLPVNPFPLPHDAIVKGDGKSLSIAAASIIAKVTRDRIMREIDREFPQFGFAKHQGYGTKAHLEALRIHGPCRHHRLTFQPVAQLTLQFDEF
ncbi:MAG: ribonuclease HII [Akkermansiaceae bacterium]|jgi:ribonuclease HII|nr:ribonuclease HII [Akkermansiaceae bacterium]MBJ7424307.1 ribonuclease HII [Akkermansiaceae bacterium]